MGGRNMGGVKMVKGMFGSLIEYALLSCVLESTL